MTLAASAVVLTVVARFTVDSEVGKAGSGGGSHRFRASATFLSSGIPFTGGPLLGDGDLVLQVRLCLHEGHAGGLIAVWMKGGHHLSAHRVKDGQSGQRPGDLPALGQTAQLLR